MPQCQDPDEHLVILIHGIRDIARWQSAITNTLRGSGFKVEGTNYGRMNLIEFLMPLSYFRNKAKLTVWTQIQHAIFLHPRATRVSLIAHSFGTYVIANILKEQFAYKFHRVIFCGSVVRYNFPIEQFIERYTSPILNDVGTADSWPAVAEATTTGYGSVGTYGFHRPGVEDRFHNDAPHGYFLNQKFCNDFWVPFLRDGSIKQGDIPAKMPGISIRLLSIFKVKYPIFGSTLLLCAYLLLRILYLPDPISYNFGNEAKFTYWDSDFTNLLRSASESCPLPAPLCSKASVVRAITERRYVRATKIEDDVIKKIVSCKNFVFPPTGSLPSRDPVAAITALSVAFPACLKTEVSEVSDSMEIEADVEKMKYVPRSGGKSGVYLCECSAAEHQSFLDSQTN